MAKVKVTLRKRTIGNGRITLYLDYYPPFFDHKKQKYSRREFLKLYLVEKPKNATEKKVNENNLHVAELIRMKRQNEMYKDYIYTPFEIEQMKKAEIAKKSFSKFFRQMYMEYMGSTVSVWEFAIQHFENFTEGRNITFGEVTPDLIRDFKRYLLKASNLRDETKKLSQNTACSYYNKMRATLRRAFNQGMLQSDVNSIVDGIKEEETSKEFLTIEEAKKLACTPCEVEIISKISIFSILTGLRYSDIIKLYWKDVSCSMDGHYIKFKQQKTKKPEWMPISSQAGELLGTRMSDNERVFPGVKKWDLYRVIPRWLASAGINKNITFHCFRHTYATLQMAAGTDIYTISKMLGHKNVKTTQIYTKLVDYRKREATEKIIL